MSMGRVDQIIKNGLWGLYHPWRVRGVNLDLAGDRFDVWVEEVARAAWECPECGNREALIGAKGNWGSLTVGSERSSRALEMSL